jgi:putative colanic acid biosysnthesis UDP-glucose lipid carrier transferase
MRNTSRASEDSAGQTTPRIPASRPRSRAATVGIVPTVHEVTAPAVDVIHEPVASHWTVTRGKEPPAGGWSKRAFDIVVAIVALIALAPLLALIALAVRLESPGQAIFRQDRGGYGGRPFRIWKFRTMLVTENRGVVQARKYDARLTRLGGFLRQSSWDELPQLFNVLMGDMSIIGPRPHALEHDAKFENVDARYAVRRRARPGVTGLAQVSGCRGPTETDEKIRARTGFDAEYVRTWSWWNDIKIMGRTFVVLVWKRDPGAL